MRRSHDHEEQPPGIAGSLELGSRIGRIFNSAETGYEKPHPGAFRGVLDAVEGADRVWTIGDSLDADFLGARAIGIPAVLVRKRREGIEPRTEDLREVATIFDG